MQNMQLINNFDYTQMKEYLTGLVGKMIMIQERYKDDNRESIWMGRLLAFWAGFDGKASSIQLSVEGRQADYFFIVQDDSFDCFIAEVVPSSSTDLTV